MPNKPFILTSQDRTFLRAKLMDVLQKGRKNAIRGSELARLLHQPDDRKIRLAIRELIAEGVPIASSVSQPMGFYIVKDEHEAAAYMRVLRERIREDESRLRDFEKAVEHLPVPEQPALLG